MQIIKYKIHTAEGGIAITDKHFEALDAMEEGLRVQSLRVSIGRTGRQTPLGSWHDVKPPVPPEVIKQYRIYLNPRESFDTLSREKAADHYRRGCVVYIRDVERYSITKRIRPVGYWLRRAPKEIIPLPDGSHYGEGL